METVAALFSAIGRGVGQFADLTFMALGGTGGTFTSPSPMTADTHTDVNPSAVSSAELDLGAGRLDILGLGLPDLLCSWELSHPAEDEIRDGLADAERIATCFE